MTTITKTTTTTTTEEVAMLDPDYELVISEFNEIKARIKAMSAEKDRLEQLIRDALHGCDAGTINGVERVRIQHRVNSKIDRAALEAGWPEAFVATLVQTPYTVLSAK